MHSSSPCSGSTSRRSAPRKRGLVLMRSFGYCTVKVSCPTCLCVSRRPLAKSSRNSLESSSESRLCVFTLFLLAAREIDDDEHREHVGDHEREVDPGAEAERRAHHHAHPDQEHVGHRERD